MTLIKEGHKPRTTKLPIVGKFNHFELAVITCLRRNPGRRMTVNEVAKQTGMSWEKAEDTLEKLHENYSVKGIKGKQVLWRLY